MDPVERVKNMVRHTLVVKPDVSNQELLDRAKEIAPEAVEGLSLRQFHGRFRLPIVRFEMAPRRAKKNGAGKSEGGSAKTASKEPKSAVSVPVRKRGRKRSRSAPVAIDGAVRAVLTEFAVELEKAETRSDLVAVMGGVDGFVKRIVDIAADAWGRPSESAPKA